MWRRINMSQGASNSLPEVETQSQVTEHMPDGAQQIQEEEPR